MSKAETRAASVVRRAFVDVLKLPAAVVFATMAGFGSLARESGLDLWFALAATAGVWGLPGQIAFVELYAAGAGALAVVMAVAFGNACFLPMTVAFAPLLAAGLGKRGWLYLQAHFLSVNTWAVSLQAFSAMPARQRWRYFLAVGVVCLAFGIAGCAAGYMVTGALPRAVGLALVFLNPLFLALLFAGARGRAVLISLVAGAALGPLFHLALPEWGILLTGAVAGSAAFAADRALARKEAGR